MFIVLLRFAANKAQAAQFMAGHQAWIERGLADGVFHLVGSLQPQLGGAIVAHGLSLDALRERVNDDPFVAAQLVQPEIIAIAPHQASERLAFLLDGAAPASR